MSNEKHIFDELVFLKFRDVKCMWCGNGHVGCIIKADAE